MPIDIFREPLAERQGRLRNMLMLAKQSGHVVVHDYFTDAAVEAVEDEAHHIPPILRRRIREWHNVSRATFSLGLPRHSLDRLQANFTVQENWRSRLRRIGLQAVHAEVFLPVTTKLAKGLQTDIHAVADSADLTTLSDIRFNRVGFNYMYAYEGNPAVIPEHTDVPEERGLVAAINLTEETTDIVPGAMHLLLGDNSASSQQVPHSVTAIRYRVGLTLAELEAPGRSG